MSETIQLTTKVSVEGKLIDAFYLDEYLRYRSHLFGLGKNPLKCADLTQKEKTPKFDITILRLFQCDLRIGNLTRQRATFYTPKGRKRIGTHTEQKPYRFEDLKVPRKHKLSVKFRCALCGKTVYKYLKPNAKNQHLRRTPTCSHTIILGTQEIPIYGVIPLARSNRLHIGVVGYFGNTAYIRSKNLTRTTVQIMYIASIRKTPLKK